jgi:hypothetical protein
MQRLRPKDSVLGGLDTGVSNTPTTLETISDLCVMMYGLHVRMNECTLNCMIFYVNIMVRDHNKCLYACHHVSIEYSDWNIIRIY